MLALVLLALQVPHYVPVHLYFMQETKDTTLTNRSLRNDFRTICEVQMRNSL